MDVLLMGGRGKGLGERNDQINEKCGGPIPNAMLTSSGGDEKRALWQQMLPSQTRLLSSRWSNQCKSSEEKTNKTFRIFGISFLL
jgi:hypothetical protein